MFKQQTVFIVGAGASAEYDLPVGAQLATTISNKLNVLYDDFGRTLKNGDKDLWNQINQVHQNEEQQYQAAAWLIRDGVLLSNSIDDFLDVHRDNSRAILVGKAAIVRSILEAERKSKLYFDNSDRSNRMPIAKAEKTWLVKLMRVLGRGVPLSEANTIFKNVSFIVFNYDRCIEHFFFNALKHLYNIDDRASSEIMKTLRIYHPYGKVADLPYEERGGIGFGGSPHGLQAPYVSLSQRIRTYTEQIDDRDEIEIMRQELVNAENIVFLGFAFHDQNLRLIKPQIALEQKEIYGTAFGMSDNDINVVKYQLSQFYLQKIRSIMVDRSRLASTMTCGQLFDHYAKSLPA